MTGAKAGKWGRQGFSLVEMVLAVAIMALLGTVVLRVFLSADSMNKQAANLDKAVNLAVDAVERMKAENPAILWNRETLSGIFPDSLIEPMEDGWRIQIYFDDNWQVFTLVRSDLPSYRLTLVLDPDPETGKKTTAVSVSISDIEKNSANPFQKNLIEDHKAGIYFLQAELPSGCDMQGVVQ
jgi:prepilin-type N-terminal cleavage/methylation domain-containing protein